MTDGPARFSRLLRPKSLAVFGGNWAEKVVEQCRRLGFDGPVWPVHPTRDEVAGVKAFRTVHDLPGAPDASFIGVNRELTIGVVEALSAMGAGGAVCFASGFLESDDAGGAALQEKLVAAAGDMPIFGPNCYGFLNYLDSAAIWPDEHGGVRVGKGVAILTQSSNIAINMTMQKRGLPVAYVVTAGNQAQSKLADIAAEIAADPRVTAIGLHIEGIGEIAAFEAFAATAKALGKPVVALKAGISEQAQAQTLSHTASLAGNEAGAFAFLDRLGIATVKSITVFLETLKLLHVHGPLPGSRLASISCSGGEASLMADLALGKAVSYPPLNAKQRERLGKALGPMVTLANPLDYHTFVWGKLPGMTEAFTAMIDAPLDLAMFVLDWPRPDRCAAKGWDVAIAAIRAAAEATGTKTAVVASMPENMPEAFALELAARGIAPMCGMEEALLAAEAAARAGAGLKIPMPAPAIAAPALPAGAILLGEAEAKQALAAHGLAVPRGIVCAGERDLVEAGRTLGYPVALKGLGIAHKSEAGAVVIGIAGKEQLLAAAAGMSGVADNFLVERMVTGGLCELIVGVTLDPAHGLVLTVGAGGVLTELLADSASVILPTTAPEIEALIGRLKVAKLLAGYRGKPPGNIAAVVASVLAVAAYAQAQAGRLIELDVNPLIVTADGAVAADALVRLAVAAENRGAAAA